MVPLSEYEQKVVQELEERLHRPSAGTTHEPLTRDPRARRAIAVVVFLIGFLMVFASVTVSVPVAVVGFALMFAGVVSWRRANQRS